jgi:hypothetical protein
LKNGKLSRRMTRRFGILFPNRRKESFLGTRNLLSPYKPTIMSFRNLAMMISPQQTLMTSLLTLRSLGSYPSFLPCLLIPVKRWSSPLVMSTTFPQSERLTLMNDSCMNLFWVLDSRWFDNDLSSRSCFSNNLSFEANAQREHVQKGRIQQGDSWPIPCCRLKLHYL